MPIDKTVNNFEEAVSDIPDGSVVMIGGFGGAGGMPHLLMLALRDQGARNLTIIGNTAGIAAPTGFGWPDGVEPIDHAVLIENGQIAKVIASFPVSGSVSRPNAFEAGFRAGEIELEVVPQGTLAERMRAAGARFVPALDRAQLSTHRPPPERCWRMAKSHGCLTGGSMCLNRRCMPITP